MKEQLISVETSKLAKKVGFNWECNNFYYQDKELGITNGNEINSNLLPQNTSAPTQSLLQKYLREAYLYNVITYVDRVNEIDLYKVNVSHEIEAATPIIMTSFKTYEEALEEGLIKTLERIYTTTIL